MTPAELDAYLTVARLHGVTRLKVGDVEVTIPPVADTAPRLSATPPDDPKTLEEYWALRDQQVNGFSG